MNSTVVDRQALAMPGGTLPPMREACWNPAYGGYPSQIFPVLHDANFPAFPLLWQHNNGVSSDHAPPNSAFASFPRPGALPKAFPKPLQGATMPKDHAKENSRGAAQSLVIPSAKDTASVPKKISESQGNGKQERQKDNGEREPQSNLNDVKSEKDSNGSAGTHQQPPESNEAGGKRKPWRILLTGEQARDIYMRRPGQENPGTSLSLAAEFGVSVKTIRDIWNRETWIRSTRSLWTPEEHELHQAAQQAKTDSNSAKSAGLFEPYVGSLSSRKRELQIRGDTGGAKKLKTEKGKNGGDGPGLHDAAADADAVAALLMMCS
eukprot:CAMPEP_0181309110 /NCGR_PEP_ID=MMETSP1101-20121128/11839_1 /TAXON_ID=46948 /ORGANISM="Rhodomonas abbreviata, Strain Caron Lab Isolate" /LENGTH=320 /DNA_ID=CAMNT_0023415573 /DNA_START=37 /DNA_END=999 /DNA_ORIENTATION=-